MLRELAGRSLRAAFLALSRRRSLGRLATRLPVTRAMVARFVAGETLDDALATLDRLHAAGLWTTVDVLGESVGSADAARAAADRYLATLDALAERGLDRNVSLKLSQGAKPGTGGMLLGSKVSPEIAAKRDLPAGVDQRSPARHPDFVGPDDLILKVEELREATDWQVPVYVKIAPPAPIAEVRVVAPGPGHVWIGGFQR